MHQSAYLLLSKTLTSDSALPITRVSPPVRFILPDRYGCIENLQRFVTEAERAATGTRGSPQGLHFLAGHRLGSHAIESWRPCSDLAWKTNTTYASFLHFRLRRLCLKILTKKKTPVCEQSSTPGKETSCVHALPNIFVKKVPLPSTCKKITIKKAQVQTTCDEPLMVPCFAKSLEKKRLRSLFPSPQRQGPGYRHSPRPTTNTLPNFRPLQKKTTQTKQKQTAQRDLAHSLNKIRGVPTG